MQESDLYMNQIPFKARQKQDKEEQESDEKFMNGEYS